MKRSVKYREQYAAALKKQTAILDACEAANRDRTAEEETAWLAAKAEMAKAKGKLDEALEIEAAELVAPAVSSTLANGEPPKLGPVKDRSEGDKRRGFASHVDFLMAAMDNSDATSRDQVNDERLRPLALVDKDDKKANGRLAFLLPEAFTPRSLQATVGSDEQGTYSDQYGGFAVPTTLLPGIRSIPTEADPTAGRTQPLPMATPSVDMLARVDKDHTTSVSGGFTVSRRAETGTIASSRAKMEKITMKANSLFGLAFETEELLDDSPISFAAIIASGFQSQFAAHMLKEKIRGTGAGEYQGVIGAPATITVLKESGQGVDSINSTNVIKMASRLWGLNDAIWIANHDTRPQLMVLSVAVGVAGSLIYTPSPTVGFPDMLLGRPIFYSEFASKLGDLGDLILGNWSQYLDGLYQPLRSAESVHVRFENHEKAFKFWLRNAGAPWWRSALTPNQSAVTLAPFVILEAR